MNAYRMMARAVSSVHWIWTFALLLGFIVQWIFPQYAMIETIALALTIATQTRWKRCPLTIAEDALRARADITENIGGSFLRYHFEKQLGIRIPGGTIGLTLKIMLVLSALWCLVVLLT